MGYPDMLIFLLPLIALAGFIDSIAGGGGMISLTGYSVAGLSGACSLGTNKFSSTFGTLISVISYARGGAIRWPLAMLSSAFAIIGSHIGAGIALRYSSQILSCMLLVTLPVLTVLTIVRPRPKSHLIVTGTPLFLLSALLAFLCGLYDGFYGPGTGMFLTLGFTALGLPLIESAGLTKAVNAASNISALLTFLFSGSIAFQIAVPAAAASILGNFIGSRFALRHGDRAIRPFLAVVMIMLYLEVVLSIV